MIMFLLYVYLMIVWLVFVKFKLLKFDLKAKIAVGVIGFLGIFGLLIALNFLHPQSLDARVVQHVTQIATRTSQPSRVLELRVQPNTPVKKGDVLFTLDRRTYEAEVKRLQAAVVEAEQNVAQLKSAYDATVATIAKAKGQLALAESEEARDKPLVAKGAVSKQDYEIHVRNLELANASLVEAQALSEKARLAFTAQTAEGENVDVAQLKAELIKAQIDLEETTVRAPVDGFVTNLQLQPGDIVRPGEAIMPFVSEPDGVVVVTMPQEYMGLIEQGNEVEICLDMYPGKTLKGSVESIIMVSGSGQLDPSGDLPSTSSIQEAARFPIKVKLDPDDAKRYRLPGGAHGAAAVYTNHGKSLKLVRRVVLRWYTWLNYFKLAM